ncbi:hypothetical protein EH165_03875 [Nakamurella antarctica]|uniref:Uncharacterized protein n=1 Tax=Nakamurella antarctica TaxID=1902245 RepID=A0A3G8ZKQ8_9ACTN|nr:hypothetical protein [Nakamurella antarctica]AZI57425.1 hypothetical protein EH165_03875 [Nakamurella antarctica]
MSRYQFSVWLPDDWWLFDLESDRISDQVERLLNQTAAIDPAVAAHRGKLEKLVRDSLRTARGQDLTFMAMWGTWSEDLPIVANLTVAMVDRPSGDDSAVLMSQLTRKAKAKVEVVRLTDIDAAVVHSRYRDVGTHPQYGGKFESAVWQWFIPTPDDRGFAVVTASTPSVILENDFNELFGEIVDSFTFEDPITAQPPDSKSTGTSVSGGAE